MQNQNAAGLAYVENVESEYWEEYFKSRMSPRPEK